MEIEVIGFTAQLNFKKWKNGIVCFEKEGEKEKFTDFIIYKLFFFQV